MKKFRGGIIIISVLLFIACDLFDWRQLERDNPLDPGAANYVIPPPEGVLDASFSTDGVIVFSAPNPSNTSNGKAVLLDGDENIVVAGDIGDSAGNYSEIGTWRFNSDGTSDSSFDSNGWTVKNFLEEDWGTCVDLAPGGKLLVGGDSYLPPLYTQGNVILRYNSNGTLDSSFDTDGAVTYDISGTQYTKAVASRSNGDVFLLVHDSANTDTLILAYEEDGDPVTGFGSSGIVTYGTFNPTPEDMILDADEKILVTGKNNSSDMILLRYLTNGTPDSTFDSDGEVTYPTVGAISGNSLALDSQGRILVTGYIGTDLKVWRYLSNGNIDTDFGSSGLATYSNAVGEDIYVDPMGMIFVAGTSGSNLVLCCFDSNGNLFTDFGTGGVVTRANVSNPAVTGDSLRRVTVAGTDISSGTKMILLRYK